MTAQGITCLMMQFGEKLGWWHFWESLVWWYSLGNTLYDGSSGNHLPYDIFWGKFGWWHFRESLVWWYNLRNKLYTCMMTVQGMTCLMTVWGTTCLMETTEPSLDAKFRAVQGSHKDAHCVQQMWALLQEPGREITGSHSGCVLGQGSPRRRPRDPLPCCLLLASVKPQVTSLKRHS
jgi:hypothetical protein